MRTRLRGGGKKKRARARTKQFTLERERNCPNNNETPDVKPVHVAQRSSARRSHGLSTVARRRRRNEGRPAVGKENPTTGPFCILKESENMLKGAADRKPGQHHGYTGTESGIGCKTFRPLMKEKKKTHDEDGTLT